MTALYLVPATAGDADLLFAWANDPETRKNAFHTEAIPYATHIRWLADRLQDPCCFLYICKKGQENIGQIRLDIAGDAATISYSIAKEQRGKGYGTALLRLIETQVRTAPELQKVKALLGYVKKENLASQKCFAHNGFLREEKDDCVAYRKVL